MDDCTAGHDVGGELALTIVRAVHEAAAGRGLRVAAVVADRAGHVVAGARMDGAPLGAMPIATDKAHSSALWNQSTEEIGAISGPGQEDWGIAGAMGGRMITFAGGVPIRRDGAQIGALGVSGARSPEDDEIARSALAALGLEA
jgi:uncharacterized protein GlcG (DUF336 family)